MAPKLGAMKPNGNVIKTLRESKHIGSRELARRCGISHQFMVRIQQGQRGASPQTIEAIAKALGVSIETISFSDSQVSAETLRRLTELLSAATAPIGSAA